MQPKAPDVTEQFISSTESWCCECGKLHEAVITAENNQVYFTVRCGDEERRVRISSDAEIFMMMRSTSAVDPAIPPAETFTWFHILEITQSCNFNCPVCFASAGKTDGEYLAYDEIIAMGKGLKARGLRAVTISGGEPSLHPELFRIIRGLKKLRLDVTMLTNGFIAGEDPVFTKNLKTSGIDYCYFQFDTLNAAAHRKIRGNDFIEVKKQALANARSAGLYFGMISTFIKDNLHETGELIKFASSFAPSLSVVTFLAAAKTGRFELDDDELVDREAIINSILNSGVVKGLDIKHFRPCARFRPLGIDIHPDCASFLFLALRRGRLEPLDNYLNMDRLYSLMNRSRGRMNMLRGFITFNLYFTLSVRLKKIIPLYRMIFGMITRRGRDSVIIVAVEQFMGEVYQDQQRTDHCTNCVVMRNGSMVSACVYQHPDPRRHQYTRAEKNPD